MRNAGLEDAQAGIKIAGRNPSNLRYADNTTLTFLRNYIRKNITGNHINNLKKWPANYMATIWSSNTQHRPHIILKVL